MIPRGIFCIDMKLDAHNKELSGLSALTDENKRLLKII